MWVNLAELNGTPGVDDDGNGYIDDVNGFNFTNNSGTIETGYHATHVAGTIAAENNNGLGVSGVAGGSGKGDGVRIMSCQILGGTHGADVPASYIYAADNGAVISQNSWGYSDPGVLVWHHLKHGTETIGIMIESACASIIPEPMSARFQTVRSGPGFSLGPAVAGCVSSLQATRPLKDDM